MPSAAIESIEAIVRLEEEFLQSRSLLDRIADTVANFTGSILFVVVHLVGFTLGALILAKMVRAVPK